MTKATSNKVTTQALGRPGSPIQNIVISHGGQVPPDAERREAFLRGAVRLGADEKQVEELRALDSELGILQEMLETKAVDHVGPAAAKAAAALLKTLGRDAFPGGVDEATYFARKNLPLSDAWRQTEADADERMKASRQAGSAKKQFWALATELAQTVAHFTRSTGDHDRMIDEIVHAGQR